MFHKAAAFFQLRFVKYNSSVNQSQFENIYLFFYVKLHFFVILSELQLVNDISHNVFVVLQAWSAFFHKFPAFTVFYRLISAY